MAFSGVHVTCSDSGNPYLVGTENSGKPDIICNPYWSETLAAPGTTTQSVRGQGYVFRVEAAADAWIAFGAAPNAGQAVGNTTGTARYLVRAGISYDFNVRDGDKLAWIAA